MADALVDIYVNLGGLEGKGESSDAFHKGKDGWIQIKSFNFGFGMTEGSWDSGGTNDSGSDGGGSSGQSGEPNLPLDFPEVTITKNCDLSSTTLLKEKCHKGDPLSKVQLVACRGGATGEQNDSPKIEFLSVIFRNVYINSISLSLSQDELPAETIKFTYDIVEMKTVWTDNETGDRLVSEPNRCGWDRQHHKEFASQD